MVAPLLLIVRLLLALVFVVAGLAKLADRPGSRQAIVNFGLPSSLAAPLGLLLPIAELTVAAALIPTATAPWGAVGGLTLLLLFVVGIAGQLGPWQKTRLPLLWPTTLRPGRVEDPRT